MTFYEDPWFWAALALAVLYAVKTVRLWYAKSDLEHARRDAEKWHTHWGDRDAGYRAACAEKELLARKLALVQNALAHGEE